MHLHRYFPCGCGAHIHIPLAIPVDTARIQIPWPKDESQQNFACLVCRQVRFYTRSNFLLDPVPSTEDRDICAEKAVFQFSLPCGIDNCVGLVEVHLVGSQDTDKDYVLALLPTLFAHSIACNTGLHRHNGIGSKASSVGFGLSEKWTALGINEC